MTEVEKTTAWIPIPFHTKLKIRAAENHSSIEIEIEKILKKEFGKEEVD